MRKTKIVCTLGPATDDELVLQSIIESGMNVARFNFSHGTHETHKQRYDQLVKLRNKLNLPVATMLDTKGPEIRTGVFKNNECILTQGQKFTLTADDIEGDNTICKISYPNLYKDVKKGDTILIDDGLISMVIDEIVGTDIVCIVMNSGKLSNNKGINLPNTKLSFPYLSEKDKSDIIFGIENGFDFIAASFVRSKQDLLDIKKILYKHNGEHIRIISKIENQEGVDNIDEIIDESDAIMVARGDMGVEIRFEEIPSIQKMIIKKAVEKGKEVITATQMLDSMMKNPRPTRAEVTDVANAIYDGTTAIMLSGESAAGKYPFEAVRTMDVIAKRTENDIDYKDKLSKMSLNTTNSITDSISRSTCSLVSELNAKAIVAITKNGTTPRMLSKYKSQAPVFACTFDERIQRQLYLTWGVTPILIEKNDDMDVVFDIAIKELKTQGLIESNDIVAIVGGHPFYKNATTNILKVVCVD